jgi:hypothetical protein
MTRVIDLNETRAWLGLRGVLGADGKVDYSELGEVRSFTIPPYVVARTALAEAFGDFCSKDSEVLLHINDWGVWNNEDWNLFKRFRQALGETAELIEKPGHLFSPGDHADLVSLVCLVLYFNWGASVVSFSGKLAVEISHDEIGWLYAAKDREVDKDWLERLDELLDSYKAGLA